MSKWPGQHTRRWARVRGHRSLTAPKFYSLIMLLIQSDMFKAIWFMVFPIVELVHGTVKSDSVFCQASGFFLAVGIEASDIAVAMIAIHSGLYIFRGEQGLYPFRNYAYAIFLLLPLLLASLAFVNKPAYANSGEYCYLPVAPDWSRRALSWVPRYVIFLIILVTYSCIYIYVRVLIRRFGAVGGGRRNSLLPFIGHHSSPSKKPINNSVPPTPPILSHGLIPSTSPSRRNSTDERHRRGSISTITSEDVELPPSASSDTTRTYHAKTARHGDNTVKWNIPNFGFDSAASTYRERLSSEPDLSNPTAAHYAPPKASTLSKPHTHNHTLSPTSSKTTTAPASGSPWTFWNRSMANLSEPSRVASQTNIFTILRRGPRGSHSSAASSSAYTSPAALDATGPVKTREKIRRQLRQLIMYPLVYIAVWVMPFIVHLTGWDSRSAPFGMIMVSLVSLCVQGLVDATVFSLKEEPWRHPRGRRPSYDIRFWHRSGSQEGLKTNVGRTREEMLLDGRIARRRMADELVQRRMDRHMNRKATTEWWDHIEESTEEAHH